MSVVKYWVGKPHIFMTPSPGNEHAYVPLYKAEDIARVFKPFLKNMQCSCVNPPRPLDDNYDSKHDTWCQVLEAQRLLAILEAHS